VLLCGAALLFIGRRKRLDSRIRARILPKVFRAVAALLLAVSLASHANAQSISLSPSVGGAGIKVSVSGSNFNFADVSATLLFNGSQPVTGICTPVAGNLNQCYFFVPNVGPGTYQVTLKETYDSASTTYTVAGPILTVSDDNPHAGELVTVTGQTFSIADTSVKLWFGPTFPDSDFSLSNGFIDVTPSSGCSVSQGAFSCDIYVPALTASNYVGDSCVQYQGYDVVAIAPSGEVAHYATTIRGGIGTVPKTGLAGSNVELRGSGFCKVALSNFLVTQSALIVNFDGQTLQTGCGLINGDADDTFDCSIQIPSSASPGVHQIAVYGTSPVYNGPVVTALADFTVPSPTQTFTLGGSSCLTLGGVWNAATSTCIFQSAVSLDPTVILNVPSGVTLYVGSASSFVTQGLTTIASGANFVNTGSYTNSGTIENSGLVSNQGVFNNSGAFITLPAGSSEGVFANQGTLVNSGFFAANAGQVGNVTVVVNGATCQSSSIQIPANSPFMIFGSWRNGACELVPPPGVQLPLVEPHVIAAGVKWTIPAGGGLLNRNELDVRGELDNYGTLTNQPLAPNGIGTLVVFNAMVNAGTLTNVAGGVTNVAGTLTNQSTINLQSSSSLAVSGTLVNQGTINIDYSSTISGDGAIVNSGAIQNSGKITTLSVLGTITNTGSGSIVNLNGGTVDGQGGTITGNIGPSIANNEGSITLAGGQYLTGAVVVESGAVLQTSARFRLSRRGC